MMLQNYQSTTIGCHLPLMEFYRIFFIGLWFWFAFLLLWTTIAILWTLLLGVFRCQKLRLIGTKIERDTGDSDLVVERYSTGDLIVLSVLRRALDEDDYRMALNHAARLEWPDHFECDEIPNENSIPMGC